MFHPLFKQKCCEFVRRKLWPSLDQITSGTAVGEKHSRKADIKKRPVVFSRITCIEDQSV